MAKSRESIIELVQNLMARAQSTTSENEARMCRERADKLIFEHAIAGEELVREEGVEVAMAKVTFEFTGTYKRAFRIGIATVLNTYGTTFVLAQIGSRTHWLYAYGEQGDIDMMTYVMASLQEQAMTAMRAWWKRESKTRYYYSESDRRKARESYLLSFFTGVAEQIEESKREASVSGSMEIALRDKKSRAEDYASQEISWKQGRRSRGRDYRINEGVEAGRNATLAAGGVEGGRKQVRA